MNQPESAILEKSTAPVTETAPPARGKSNSLTRLTLKSVAGLIAGSAVALGGLELAFATAHIGEEEFVQITPVLGFWHAPHRFVTWRSEGFSQSVTNSDGMRDEEFSVAKPAGTIRIAIIGDSMTEGYQVAADKTFVKQLQDRLNQHATTRPDNNKPLARYQVMNFGMSGMSTVQALYLFKKKIAKYQPDICILAYHVMDNEKNSSGSGQDRSLPRPYCFIDSNGRLMTDWQPYDSWQNSPAAEQYKATEQLRSNSRIFAVCTKLDLQLASLPIYQQFKNLLHGTKSTNARQLSARTSDTGMDLLGTSYQAPALPNTMSASAYTKMQTRLIALAATDLAKSSTPAATKATKKSIEIARQWRENLYLSQEHCKVTAAVMGALNAACRAAHCRFMMAALPAPNNSMLFFKELIALKALAQKLQIPFADINDTFPSLAPMEASPLYYNIHYTPAGHALVAQRLERFLIESARQKQ